MHGQNQKGHSIGLLLLHHVRDRYPDFSTFDWKLSLHSHNLLMELTGELYNINILLVEALGKFIPIPHAICGSRVSTIFDSDSLFRLSFYDLSSILKKSHTHIIQGWINSSIKQFGVLKEAIESKG